MDKLMEKLYNILVESVPSTWRNDPDYQRYNQEYNHLWDQIAADLGQDGKKRLESLSSARNAADDIWQQALFRRTLALGIALGQLQSAF